MNLNDYQLIPYEREWFMREESGQRYYVVRLKDIPAVAGDGATRDEAAEDLREAFDEFVLAWLEAGREVPLPARPFTPLGVRQKRPAREWTSGGRSDRTDPTVSSSRADSVEQLSKLVLVKKSSAQPSLEAHSALPLPA